MKRLRAIRRWFGRRFGYARLACVGLLIGVAALRASSEPVFFPTLLDFFYFSWFLMYLKHARPSAVRATGLTKGVPSHA